MTDDTLGAAKSNQEPSELSELAATELTAPELDAPTVPAPASAGQMLREARQASGMHIATLSMALKVSVKKLEALESDDWGQLPDAVFVRALATSICRHIKTDSAPILAALPQTAHAKLMDDQSSKGLNQTFRAANDPKPSLLKVPVSMPMMAGALVLLLAALVLIFLPDMAKRQETKKTEVVEAVAPMPPVLVPSEVASAPLEAAPLQAASVPTAAVLSSPSAAPTAPSTPPASAAVVAAAPVVPPLAVASAPAAVAPVVSASGSILRMTAKGQVWIEVKDSKGVVLVQRTLQAKEVVNVSGQPPLAVVVGRINEMQSIEVRGKPFSLAGLSPDNVARFEVK